MDSKVQSIISYLFFPIGWLIAYFGGKEKNELSRYHFKQSLGLGIRYNWSYCSKDSINSRWFGVSLCSYIYDTRYR